jgi:chromosome segregation ATPase
MTNFNLALALLLSSPIHETSAFSTSVNKNRMAMSIGPLLWSSSPEDSESEGIFEPRPPDFSPMVDEQLQQDLMNSERKIMMYEAEINMVREALDLKQDELQEERNIFRDEKTSLLQKISNFTTLLSQRDKELEQVQGKESEEDQLNKVNELIDEVKSLSKELGVKTREYMEEKEATKALRERFEKAQDTLEFEQMRFEKEKKALQASIDKEKNYLKSLKVQMKGSQIDFESAKESLLNKIKEEEDNYDRTKQSWNEAEFMMKAVEEELRDSLLKREELLAQSKKERASEKEALNKEVQELKKNLAQEQDKTQRTISELMDVREQFRTEKTNLEAIVNLEKNEIEKLQNGLLLEEKKFEKEKSRLESKLEKESERLKNIEEELAGERDTFSKEKERLEQQVTEEIKKRQVKARIMNERYTEIRREMTKLWEDSKRRARKEEARLKRRYESKLADVKKKAVRLEGELQDTNASNSELASMLDDSRTENVQLKGKNKKLEAKYKTLLTDRDGIISHQSRVIDQQKITIEGYESSYRLIAKLSFRVTGRKIKQVGGSLKRILSSKKDDEETL